MKLGVGQASEDYERTMRITLLGTFGGEVTGSSYVLQTDRANVMIDCGLFQGSNKVENYNRLPRSSSPSGSWMRWC